MLYKINKIQYDLQMAQASRIPSTLQSFNYIHNFRRRGATNMWPICINSEHNVAFFLEWFDPLTYISCHPINGLSTGP